MDETKEAARYADEEQEKAIGMILTDYRRITRFLDEKTIFKARPIHIIVDGPYSIGATLDVSLSAKSLTSREA